MFDDVVEGKLSASRVGDSLDGDEAAATRAWAVDYLARNRDMLELMARL